MSGLRVPVVGPRCQIRLASAAPAAPNSAIDTSTPANSTKAQTHSPQTACFQRFSPNGSALWQPHRLKLRPRRHRSGGIAPHEGPTRRRHADAAFRMAQNPPAVPEGPTPVPAGYGRARPGFEPTHRATQHTPLTVFPVQNSPRSPTLTVFPVQNSPRSPEMARFGAIHACRESFVPFSPPRSRAGRILYRTRGRNRASRHNSTPGTTGVERKTPKEPQEPAAVPAGGGGASTGWHG